MDLGLNEGNPGNGVRRVGPDQLYFGVGRNQRSEDLVEDWSVYYDSGKKVSGEGQRVDT
jgi:hypothetical protein